MATSAIAILNYNGKNFLKKFLPTLIKHSNNTPIYIGDNGSIDGSIEFLKNDFPEIRLIELKENYGYSKGYNLVLKKIEVDYVALINSDVEVTSNWLGPLLSELEQHDSIAAVQPKIKSFNKRDYFEYAGAAGGFIDRYGYPFCRGRLFNTVEKDKGQYNNAINIKWASGACFVVRKTAFNEAGGFDDDFFAHMEEIDLCWRLTNKGYSIKYIPESTVYHVGGGTLAYESPFKTYLNYRNGLYLLLKNIPEEQLRQKLVIRVLLDWLNILYFLVQGKLKQAKAISRAHIDVLKTKKQFEAKRQSDINTTGFMENYSIVWKYFIKGKKTYNQL